MSWTTYIPDTGMTRAPRGAGNGVLALACGPAALILCVCDEITTPGPAWPVPDSSVKRNIDWRKEK